MEWIKPNTITGSAAEGIKYFRREDLEEKLWNEISKNNHVLFLAPRRVGKSSIVIYMANNSMPSFSCKFENIQTDKSIQEFYKRMCDMIYAALSAKAKGKSSIKNWWDKWTITSASKDGIGIAKVEIDYRDKFFEMLKDLKEQDEKVVLFLDEFPDVVWNIYKVSGINDAQSFLDDVRSIRQTKEFKAVFIMVLLGSVGLSHIVKKVTGRTDKVNDLHHEYLQALKPQNAMDFLDYLVKDATIQIDIEIRKYLLQKIGHHIPYYIQVILEECDDLLYDEERPKLTIADIDKAYKQLLKKNEKFNDWDSRLSRYFSEKYPYLLEILSMCADKGELDLQEMYNIAVLHKNTQEWKADIDDILIADGYIFEDEGKYSFNSPLLRDWWKSRHPNMKK